MASCTEGHCAVRLAGACGLVISHAHSPQKLTVHADVASVVTASVDGWSARGTVATLRSAAAKNGTMCQPVLPEMAYMIVSKKEIQSIRRGVLFLVLQYSPGHKR